MLRGVLARLAAAALVVAAGGTVAAPAPASAAACSGSTGVTVVVDHNELGDGVQQVCVAGGGGDTASALFAAAGYPLTYAQRDPGFVCRVRGLPTSDSDPCVNASPADAYWALYWSDGKSGSWTYSSLGAGSLTVPDGGYVAFSWQGSSTKSPPSATPAARRAPTASPSASAAPTKPPAQGGGSGSSTGQGSPGGAAAPATDAPVGPSRSTEPGASPSAVGEATGSRKDERSGRDRGGRRGGSPGSNEDEAGTSARPSPSAAGSTTYPAVDDETTPTAARPEDGGLPAWVPLLVVALLLGAVAVVGLRRRGAPTP